MDTTVLDKIRTLKNELGSRVVIPVHHYQNAEVTAIADFLGDSYKLAVDCSKTDSEFIVFCGVLFMAESSDILKKPHQKVVIPASNADCPMANMADIKTVEAVYSKLTALAGDVIAPVVYMNSYADLKAFCGAHGGSVCTSSNADAIMSYYLKKGMKILFFPDANLGLNTSLKLGYSHKDMIRTSELDRYNDEKIILWDGFCPVHKRFNPVDIAVLKKHYPDIKIIVHPECQEDISVHADFIGSTEFILKTISNSPAGSVWGVGTETVFVDKISSYYPDKTIVPLKTSECVNMKKTTLELVLKSLENIIAHIDSDGKVELNNLITVGDEYKVNAHNALTKMIAIAAGEL